jgi:putative transposase
VQTCVVHLVRNTLRYTSGQHWGKITTDLRTVYTAATLDAATERFAEFEERWGVKYPAVIRLWRDAWEEFIFFLSFPPDPLDDLHDQRHRIAQRPVPTVHSDQGSLPQRGVGDQDSLPDDQDPRRPRRQRH